jgi:hypothetical protein
VRPGSKGNFNFYLPYTRLYGNNIKYYELKQSTFIVSHDIMVLVIQYTFHVILSLTM